MINIQFDCDRTGYETTELFVVWDAQNIELTPEMFTALKYEFLVAATAIATAVEDAKQECRSRKPEIEVVSTFYTADCFITVMGALEVRDRDVKEAKAILMEKMETAQRKLHTNLALSFADYWEPVEVASDAGPGDTAPPRVPQGHV